MAKTNTQSVSLASYIAWGQALAATASSLYFSEIAGYLPCLLCWYQRIAMYPLVIILGVGILRKEKKLYQYVLPFSIVGGLIALYHVLLYYSIFPESEQTCRAGVSCTSKYIEWLGFITIPALSLAAFTLITVCMIVLYRKEHREQGS